MSKLTIEQFNAIAWSKRVAAAINDKNLSNDAKTAIKVLVETAADGANIYVTAPEIIETVYRLSLENLSETYRDGINDSMKSLLDVFQCDYEETEAEINAMNPTTKILDLSEIKPPDENGCVNLAERLVDVLADPMLPSRLKRNIEDALAENNQSMDAYYDVGYVASILCRNQE